MSDRTIGIISLIVGILALLLAVWIGYREDLKNRFRTWDRATLKKLIDEMKVPEYIENHRYLRDRDALIGLTILAALSLLESLTFTAMYPVRRVEILRPLVVLQLFGGYIALLCFLSAASQNRRATSRYVQRRLERLNAAFKKYFDPNETAMTTNSARTQPR